MFHAGLQENIFPLELLRIHWKKKFFYGKKQQFLYVCQENKKTIKLYEHNFFFVF
jgi:hypothetical protein